MELFRKLKVFIGPSEVRPLVLIFLMMMGGAVLEVLGVGILLPIIAIIGDEGIITRNHYLSSFYNFLGAGSFKEFLFYTIGILIFFFVFKNVFLYCSVVLQNRFLKRINHNVASRLFRSYVFSNYAVTLRRNSAQQIRNLSIVSAIVQALISPLFVVATEATIAVAIFAFIVWENPLSSLFIGICLFLAVGVFYLLVRKKLGQLGEIQNLHHVKMMQTIQQGLNSVKETRILAKEDFFSQEYDRELNGFLEAVRIQSQLGQSPRFYIEGIIVTLLLLLMGWFLEFGKSPAEIVATTSVFAIAAIRLMPGFSRISAGLNSIRFYRPSLDEVYSDLISSELVSEAHMAAQPIKSFLFEKSLALESVHFTYEGASSEALHGISLNIKKNQMIGFAGSSGAGKTTIVDIILGLLIPTQGKVLVDGVDIQSNLRGWQRCLGYIPQHIYFMDDSIRRNIAFGIADGDVDDQKVWRALELAQLAEYVRSLPLGLDTFLGERGTRLSGGQRQRIGIARALYHEPQVLIMDEATAALDTETERLFVEALFGLQGKVTMLVIAHRLTTLKKCDHIFALERGSVVKQGDYQQVFNSTHASEIFTNQTSLLI